LNNKIIQDIYFPHFLKENDSEFQYVYCDHGSKDLKSKQYTQKKPYHKVNLQGFGSLAQSIYVQA
jgi:hypothetical protein